ncbi:hypothetical protein [Staphylococcus equorum]|uniref:BppU N-terminal domain-containing protein n=1 Tax=Staphylococcus equorum TaxID=246432 RepID=A0A9X4LHU5_9STAP|nr:hypothetical protein [Staphylococcus equorum]MDG0860333.1 hypothetical protein [Staphylococcus equorum]
MSNGIDKKAFINLKSEPHLKPISDLGVGFYNLDENTARLIFQLRNTKGPLLISKENLKTYAYFESENGSASDVIELNIIDEFKGIVEITVSKDFLQASTDSKVIGQVYIGVNNETNNARNNEVAVFGEFSFDVSDALINKISSFTKIEYIRMFDQLKSRIEQKVNDIEAAILNGDDYVAEMKSVLQKGIETLNQIVSNSTINIQKFIDQAKIDVNKTKNEATKDITVLSNNSKINIQDIANSAINIIEDTTEEATVHVDEKMVEFNQAVEDNKFLTPDKLTEDLTELDWQKYKLTNDNGRTFYLTGVDWSDTEFLDSLMPGSYYITVSKNAPIGVSFNAFVFVHHRDTGSLKRIEYKPYDSARSFVKTYYKEWSDWMETGSPEDTGWVPFTLINGAASNTEYKGKDGFDCSYRTVTIGTVTTNYLRINGRNITDGQTFAQLPSTMVKNAQTFIVRTPTNKPVVFITVYTDGTISLLVNKSTSINEWGSSDYIYGEFSWIF